MNNENFKIMTIVLQITKNTISGQNLALLLLLLNMLLLLQNF